MSTRGASDLIFGIFAGFSGTEGPPFEADVEPYDLGRIDDALADLEPADASFVIRAYGIFRGAGGLENVTPRDVERLIHGSRQLEFVQCYRSATGDVAGWTRAVRDTIRTRGTTLGALPTPDFRTAVEGVIGHFRRTITTAGIPPEVPIRIRENGWPTGDGRSADRQADVIEAIVGAVRGVRESFNVTHYDLFALRDAAGARPGMPAEWGLLCADYRRKPAFARYQALIRHGPGRVLV
jgi:hypothetical protein